MRFVSILLAAALASQSVSAFAWGRQGHIVIASVAQRALTPAAKRRVEALLALEPGATLASIANWADTQRDRDTGRWHYLNLPRDADCQYVAARDCPDGQCVLGAIQAQADRLGSTAPDLDRLEALKYLVHFVGDVHQPLHVGYADDKGGNIYQVQAFGKGSNLHALWDTGLLRAIEPDAEVLTGQLLIGITAARVAAEPFAPAAWARESCAVVAQAGFYPPTHRLPDDYLQTYEPVVRQRLQAAGLRLAATLNRVLGGEGTP